MNFTTKEECLTDLSDNYTNPGHPIAFSGINNIYNYYDKILSIKEIESFLASNESYTVHREFKNQQRNPSFSHFKRYQFQIDLADVRQLSKANKGVNYLLNCVDTFTRYAFTRPLFNKTAAATLDGFKSILEESGHPIHIVSDKGSEIVNKSFKAFCEKNNINLFHNYTSVHASYVERFNRTLKQLMYKYMTENETDKYIDKLQDLIRSYNNRKHRIIGMTPAEAELPENHKKVSENLNKYHLSVKKRKQKFVPGQLVRIAKQKTVFSRGFKPTTNFEVFRIARVKNNLPIPLYILEEYDSSSEILGGFYGFELTSVNSDIFRVEKVLKKKKEKGRKKLFVKWKGFSEKYNSWINESDIVRVFQNE